MTSPLNLDTLNSLCAGAGFDDLAHYLTERDYGSEDVGWITELLETGSTTILVPDPSLTSGYRSVVMALTFHGV